MKYLNRYEIFLEAFIGKDKEKAIEQILQYLQKKTGIDFYPYNELYHIQKGNEFLTGQLFLCLKTDKALRLNWIKGDIRSQLHSIDLWSHFTFHTSPNFTLKIEGISIIPALPQIFKFFTEPQEMVNTVGAEVAAVQENQRIEDLENKLKRARKPEVKDQIRDQIDRLKAYIAEDEKREKDSDQVQQSDLNLGVFKAIEEMTIQVANGKSNSLIVTGISGVGKTQTVIDALDSLAMVEDVDYYIAGGTITTAALYETLFKHRNGLVVFDDCDVVFKEPDSLNILKKALDTYPIRKVSRLTKGTTFDSTGMSDDEIQSTYEESGKLPNRFEFKGRVIFISNIDEDKFDDALLSRSLHVDVHLNRQEIVERMKEVMVTMLPDVSMDQKQEALDWLIHITETYPVKFDLNIRTLIHSINLRADNNRTVTIGGQEEPVWKLLVKKYLIKTKRYK